MVRGEGYIKCGDGHRDGHVLTSQESIGRTYCTVIGPTAAFTEGSFPPPPTTTTTVTATATATTNNLRYSSTTYLYSYSCSSMPSILNKWNHNCNLSLVHSLTHRCEVEGIHTRRCPALSDIATRVFVPLPLPFPHLSQQSCMRLPFVVTATRPFT